eukprot:1492389-Pyramimonas_sp.AAC.1
MSYRAVRRRIRKGIIISVSLKYLDVRTRSAVRRKTLRTLFNFYRDDGRISRAVDELQGKERIRRASFKYPGVRTRYAESLD